jgi:hypothetical protein
MDTLTPAHVRYIRLGQARRWARICRDKGELHFGYPSIPHELCQAGDWDAVIRHFAEKEGKTLREARAAKREIYDFYTLGMDCLWITFDDHRLWWAYAKPGVTWLGGDGVEHGYRSRQTVDGWHNKDLKGRQLKAGELSTRLTLVASYQRTICRVKAEDELLRCLRGEEDLAVARARSLKLDIVKAAEELISRLDPRDFETLVDLIFSRTGWQRISRLGGDMPDADLFVRDTATEEVGMVQVKSQASQAVLDRYIEIFDDAEIYHCMFFVCHSPKGELRVSDRPDVHVWVRERLADMAVKAGLYDWLLQRAA